MLQAQVIVNAMQRQIRELQAQVQGLEEEKVGFVAAGQANDKERKWENESLRAIIEQQQAQLEQHEGHIASVGSCNEDEVRKLMTEAEAERIRSAGLLQEVGSPKPLKIRMQPCDSCVFNERPEPQFKASRKSFSNRKQNGACSRRR